ncbi:MAG: hypothetical protein WAV13_00370 [Thermodesulfovibrionales bacterium]
MIVDRLKEYIATFPELANEKLFIDHTDLEPTNYSIQPLPGSIILETTIVGKTKRSFPFAFVTVEFTVDDVTRLGTNGFYEKFARWLEVNSASKPSVLPDLDPDPLNPTGMVAESIQATTWGYLFEEDESGTGRYHIQCELVYEQAKL